MDYRTNGLDSKWKRAENVSKKHNLFVLLNTETNLLEVSVLHIVVVGILCACDGISIGTIGAEGHCFPFQIGLLFGLKNKTKV